MNSAKYIGLMDHITKDSGIKAFSMEKGRCAFLDNLLKKGIFNTMYISDRDRTTSQKCPHTMNQEFPTNSKNPIPIL